MVNDPGPPVLLRTAGLGFTYPDGSPGLREVALEVRAGEVVLLLGANGSGKSTLLQCVVGLLPGEGIVEVCGTRLGPDTLREVRRAAGLVFQEPDDQLFCPTVLEDVAFGPLHAGLDPERARAIARETLHWVGLAGFEERVPHHLSHGEKKRVALAGVLALEPRLLLLDEPTAGLDPRSAMGLMEILERHRRQGKGILATTHDLHLVGELADRVIILGETRTVVASGPPGPILSDLALLTRHNLMHTHRHRHGDLVHAHPHSPLHAHAHDHSEGVAGEHAHGPHAEHAHDHDHNHTHDGARPRADSGHPPASASGRGGVDSAPGVPTSAPNPPAPVPGAGAGPASSPPAPAGRDLTSVGLAGETAADRRRRLDLLAGRASPFALLGLRLAEEAVARLDGRVERIRLACPTQGPCAAAIDGVQSLGGFSLGSGRLVLEPGTGIRVAAEGPGTCAVLAARADVLALLGRQPPDLDVSSARLADLIDA